MAFSRTDPLPNRWIGVDLNTTGHIAVVAHPETGKVMKLGKKTPHVHAKYSHLLERYRKSGKRAKVKKIRNRERSILKDLNHQISKQIVGLARVLDCGIKLEKLYSSRQIRKRKPTASYEFSLNNGSFYQLQKMVETKARKAGIYVAYVNPAFTSKHCSRCGMTGIRKRKRFECPHCGHADHADVNAAFNIASASFSVDRLYVDRDAYNGSTDTPKRTLARTPQHSKPGVDPRPGMSESIHAENIFTVLEQLSIPGTG
jgi:putative transposase